MVFEVISLAHENIFGKGGRHCHYSRLILIQDRRLQLYPNVFHGEHVFYCCRSLKIKGLNCVGKCLLVCLKIFFFTIAFDTTSR